MSTLIQKNNRELPVGFCDSGVGGLSVFAKFKQLMPNENTIYYGDLENVPYGSKSKDKITGYLKTILNYFKSQNVKAVVLACNTTSAVAYEEVKNDYNFPIYPIIQSSAKILAKSGVKRLGIFATLATINSGAYEKEIKKYNPDIQIYTKACPGWVEIVENKTFNNKASINLVKKYFDELMLHTPEKIVLGCTHYPFLTGMLSKLADSSIFIDPAIYFSEFIKRDLIRKELNNLSNTPGKEIFVVSANPEQFRISGELFYHIKNNPVLL